MLKKQGRSRERLFYWITTSFLVARLAKKDVLFLRRVLEMIDPKDEKWLKKALKQCFGNINEKTSKDKILLEGFSMLIRNMVKNIENDLAETRKLWKKNPASEELKEKFDSLARCLFYLERYCREKVERELT